MRQDPATTAQSTGTGSDLLSPRVLGNGHQVTTQMLGCGCPKPSWPMCVTRALNREPGDLQQVSMWGKHRSWGTEPAPNGPQETTGSRSGATLHPTPRGPKTPGLRRAKVKSRMRNPDIRVVSAIRMMDMMTLKPRSFLPGPAGGKSPGHAPLRSREWPQMRHLLSRLARVEKDVDLESVQPGPGHELKATDTLPSREPPDELLSPRTVLMAPAGTTDVGLSAPQRSRRKGGSPRSTHLSGQTNNTGEHSDGSAGQAGLAQCPSSPRGRPERWEGGTQGHSAPRLRQSPRGAASPLRASLAPSDRPTGFRELEPHTVCEVLWELLGVWVCEHLCTQTRADCSHSHTG